LWALPSQALNLAIAVDLVVLQYSEFDLLALVLDLLWSGVNLLFTLLATTTETKHQVECGLLLNVVVGEGTSVLELLASEDKTLLVGRNSFLVLKSSASVSCGVEVLTLDFGLDIVDGVRRLHLKGDSLAREGLDEDLHGDAGLNKYPGGTVSSAVGNW
jgi:hypothetical protein